jgi:hypothetical protein
MSANRLRSYGLDMGHTGSMSILQALSNAIKIENTIRFAISQHGVGTGNYFENN